MRPLASGEKEERVRRNDALNVPRLHRDHPHGDAAKPRPAHHNGAPPALEGLAEGASVEEASAAAPGVAGEEVPRVVGLLRGHKLHVAVPRVASGLPIISFLGTKKKTQA